MMDRIDLFHLPFYKKDIYWFRPGNPVLDRQSDGGRGRRDAGLSACNRLAGAICMEAYAGRTEDQ